MSKTNTLLVSQSKLDGEFDGNPKYKKYEAQLKSIDTNGDGMIDIGELCEKIEEMATIEKQRRLLKWATIITMVFALLTIAATVGLVYAVVALTKDTNVSSSGILVTKDSAATPIATGQVITLDSLNSLYTKSLDELAEVSFLVIPNANGGRVLHVAEIDLVANTSATVTTDAGAVYVIDAFGVHEQVANLTGTGLRKLLSASDNSGTVGSHKYQRIRLRSGGPYPMIQDYTLTEQQCRDSGNDRCYGITPSGPKYYNCADPTTCNNYCEAYNEYMGQYQGQTCYNNCMICSEDAYFCKNCA